MDYLTLGVDCGIIRVTIPSGSILFTSYPPGADIYIIASGGDPPTNTLLQTPNTIPDLPVGDYDYILKLTGFEDYISTATVNANDVTVINVNLVPIPTSPIVAALGVSALGILLITSSSSVIPLTTGRLGGSIVSVKL